MEQWYFSFPILDCTITYTLSSDLTSEQKREYCRSLPTNIITLVVNYLKNHEVVSTKYTVYDALYNYDSEKNMVTITGNYENDRPITFYIKYEPCEAGLRVALTMSVDIKGLDIVYFANRLG